MKLHSIALTLVLIIVALPSLALAQTGAQSESQAHAQVSAERASAEQGPAADLLQRALLESHALQARAQRLKSGFVASYIISGAGLIIGVGMLAGNDCYSVYDPYDYSLDQYTGGRRTQRSWRCRDPDGFRELQKGSAVGLRITTASLSLMLGAGLPMHRASLANRRAAAALQNDPSSIESWNRHAHRAQLQRRVGRNLLFASAAGATMSLAAALTIPATNHDLRQAKRGDIALWSAVGSVSAAIAGGILFDNGNRLLRKANSSDDLQVFIAPLFLDDGAGLSLWMGF